MSNSKKKINAVFELRKAAEKKGRAEEALDRSPSSNKRDVLLDAQITLEEKTLEALEVCHECDRVHAPSEPHLRSV